MSKRSRTEAALSDDELDEFESDHHIVKALKLNPTDFALPVHGCRFWPVHTHTQENKDGDDSCPKSA